MTGPAFPAGKQGLSRESGLTAWPAQPLGQEGQRAQLARVIQSVITPA